MAQQDNQEATRSVAPLPTIAGGNVLPANDRPLENPWQQSALRLEIDCRKRRLNRPHNKKEGRVIPSRFRHGDIQIDAEGMYFTGFGGQPLAWLSQLALAGLVVALLTTLYDVYAVFNGSHLSFTNKLVLLIIVILAFLTFIFSCYWNDFRTIPIQFAIPWEAVTHLRIKSSMRHAVLIYESHRITDKKGEKTVFGHLPITVSTPSDMRSFADLTEKFVGDRIQYLKK